MRSLSLFAALLLAGCAARAQHVSPLPLPSEPLPPEAAALRRPGDSDYAARVRLELTRQREVLRDCFAQAPGWTALQGRTVSEVLYVSPGIAYFPRHSDTPPLRAFEQCVSSVMYAWTPPVPVSSYEGVWVKFHFEEEDGPGSSAEHASPLFVLEGVRAALTVSRHSPFEGDAAVAPSGPVAEPVKREGAGMVRPRLLSGPTIVYSQRAIAHGVRGVMVVKCRITTEGLLEVCRILRPQPFMEGAVLGALSQNRYTPVLFRGVPTGVDYTFTLNLTPPRK